MQFLSALRAFFWVVAVRIAAPIQTVGAFRAVMLKQERVLNAHSNGKSKRSSD